MIDSKKQPMNLNLIYQRVSKWNAARYDRVHNLPLTASLLKEELTEYLDADEEVHQLDGLCDLIYVALGALWKHNVDDNVMNEDMQTAGEMTHALLQTNTLMPIYFIGSFIQAMEHDLEFPETLALHMIISLAMIQMQAMGLSLEDSYEALTAVCDSNDSKTIEKTAPDVKANKDKGAYFVPPEPKLQQILDLRSAN